VLRLTGILGYLAKGRYTLVQAFFITATFAASQVAEASEGSIVFRKSEPHATTDSELIKLSVGDSAVLEVLAKFPINHTRIALIEGRSYRFVVPRRQIWTDWFISCDADGYSHSALSIIQERFRSTKPLPNQNWFALVGAVDNRYRTPFLIGTGALVCSVPASGELVLFANDAKCFYWNNFGRIQVVVTRVY
jgi:hypothetical protein